LLCASCYEQIGVPFPDEPEDELRRWHEEVICKFREHLRRTSPKPKVYNANVRFFMYDVGYGKCLLCCVDVIFRALAERPVATGGKMAGPAVLWRKGILPTQDSYG
jgi:hypothetical protein